MSNIEIHGLEKGAAKKLRKRIVALFKGKSYADGLVVTIHQTDCEDVHGKKSPFLRLFNDSRKRSVKIVSKLDDLDIDVEYMALDEFIEKKSTRRKK